MADHLIILGAGESGIGAAILGKKQEFTVFVSDKNVISETYRTQLEATGIPFEEGQHTDEKIFAADLIVKSPGIPDSAEIIQNARSKNIPVISEVEFAFRYKGASKFIAITGTNGKTTTTLLTYHLLKVAGLNVAVGGNVGTSIAKLVAEGDFDFYVVEVSSFQLDGVQFFKPDIAVLLNITPDHLDRYDHMFDQYVKSKFKILENLTNEEAFIYSADSEAITEELSRRKVEACMFAMSVTAHEKNKAYLKGEHLIFDFNFRSRGHKYTVPISEISLIGKHNMVNSMAAVMSALCLDIPISKVLKGLKTFKNAPHRLEKIGKIEGVTYINDSKATNVDAVYYALDGLPSGIIWIAGGVDKGNEYEQLEELVAQKVKAIICLGKDNMVIRKFFEPKGHLVVDTLSAEEAVAKAHEIAQPKDVVLLSPACASFDLFSNYEHRGDAFRQAVHTLKTQIGIAS
ncbi:MAG: UDP-N-acetylmuramoyl-L-alanine--D-glutamate ligase [Bacteroidota bacterium]